MPVTLPNELVLLTLEYFLTFEAPTKPCKQAQITPESAKDILSFCAVSHTFAKLADNLLPNVLQQKRVQITATDLDMLDRFTRREAVSNRMSALCISTALPVDLPQDYHISDLQEQATKQWRYLPSATEALTTIASRLVNLKDVAIEGDPKRLIGEDCNPGHAKLVEHMRPRANYAVLKALSDAGRAPAQMKISRWPFFAQGTSKLGNLARFTFPSIMHLDISFIDTGRVTSSEEQDLYDHATNMHSLYHIFPNLADLRLNMIPAGRRTYSLFKNPQRLPWFLRPCLTTLTRLELAMNQCTQYFAMAYRNNSSLRHLALYNTEDRDSSAPGILQYISTRLLYHGQLDTLYLQFPTQSFTNEDLRHIPMPLIVWGAPPTPFTKRIHIRQLPLGYEDSPEDARSSLGGGVEGWGEVFPGDFEVWLGERDDLRLKKVWAPMMLPTPSPN